MEFFGLGRHSKVFDESHSDLSLMIKDITDRIGYDTVKFVSLFNSIFDSDKSEKFELCKQILSIFCVFNGGYSVEVPLGLFNEQQIAIAKTLPDIFEIERDKKVKIQDKLKGLNNWLNSRIRDDKYWIDISVGHACIASIYLTFFCNRSVTSFTHPCSSYLSENGICHLRNSSCETINKLTQHIKIIDETIGIIGELPHQLGHIENLEEIYLRRQSLTGKIPEEFGFLSKLRVLSMANNELTGQIPQSFSNLRNLQKIVLHNNKLSGSLCHLNELNCIVSVGCNEFVDELEDDEKGALVCFRHEFDINDDLNWSKHRPLNKWSGVGILNSHVHTLVKASGSLSGNLNFPALKIFKHIMMIEFANMPNIVGTLDVICDLTSLRRLCICKCGVTGPIPEKIGSMTELNELQLFGNRLTGPIPSSIGNLTNLTVLSLGEYDGDNDFDAGPIPESFSNLTNLKSLFVANCNITGQIPEWIGNLTHLMQFDIQSNKLEGVIPTSLSCLTQLTYCNLKNNKFDHSSIAPLVSLIKLNRLSIVNSGIAIEETDKDELKLALPYCKIWY